MRRGGCEKKTCAQLSASCGKVADGCSAMLDCGTCPAGQTCGAVTANVCGTGECKPETDKQFCTRVGKSCGSVTDFDNCENARVVATCGSCSAGGLCGAVTPNICCAPDTETDAAICGRLGKNCGQVTTTDNCRQTRTASCGSCGAQQVCGGTVANVCEAVYEFVALPGGTFTMGCLSQDTQCDADEMPLRQVTVSPFALGKTEVLTRQYGQCVTAGRCTAPDTGGDCNWQAGREEHPINCIDWTQAKAFC